MDVNLEIVSDMLLDFIPSAIVDKARNGQEALELIGTRVTGHFNTVQINHIKDKWAVHAFLFNVLPVPETIK